MSDILELLKFESNEINHFFEKASIEGKGTPQEVSDRREIAVSKFLGKFFPFPYRIAKGNIADSYGKRRLKSLTIISSAFSLYFLFDGFDTIAKTKQ